MKRFLLSLFSLVFLWNHATAAVPGKKDWEAVDKLIEKKLPKSALAALASLEAAAMAEKAWPEACRAIVTRIQVEAGLRRNDPFTAINALEKVLATAPPEMLPVLQVVSAEWLYTYFYDHRWPLLQRTQGASGEDPATWDRRRFLTEVEARFQKALAGAPELRAIPIGSWGGLLKPHGLPDTYLPTLYDFIAGEALAFRTMGEQAVVWTGENFDFTENSPALGTLAEFLAWKPEPGGTSEAKAFRLFQEVMNFHKDDPDPGALVMLDLQRLEWAREKTGITANARALRQYTAIYQQYANHEISLRARALVAHLMIQEQKAAAARQVLQEGLVAFGNSPFAPRCRNLIKWIEDHSLSIDTERIWNGAGPEIVVTSRNLRKVFFRLYPEPKGPRLADWVERTSVDPKVEGKMLATPPLRAWPVDLPPREDFLEHTARVPAPADLKPGGYVLFASENEKFTEKDNTVTCIRVLVSPLGLVVRKDPALASGLHTWVLDAVSGEPLQGAEVTPWRADWSPKEGKERLVKLPSVLSDIDGFAAFQPERDAPCYVSARLGGQTAFSKQERGFQEDNFTGLSGEANFLFTDRAIYRPGQTIRFKGIRVIHGKGRDDYRTLPDVQVRIVLKGPNGQTAGTAEAVTNAYGSFSGAFTAPQGLTGEYTLYEPDIRNAHTFSVEEYKRPRFEVAVDPPAAGARLGGEVKVKVKAMAYTGAPVDGATVKWYVFRAPAWPVWAWVAGNARAGGRQEMSRGTAVTGADGAVEITFTAMPGGPPDPVSENWFTYQVSAEVTDPAGETRTGERDINLGYAAMKADLQAGDWQSAAVPVAFTAGTTTLDGEPVPAEGTLTVHRLVSPEKVHREEPGAGAEDSRFWVTREKNEFTQPSGERDGKDLSHPLFWDAGEVVQRDPFRTDAKGSATVPVKLGPGAYLAVLETKDKFGTRVTARTRVTVIDPAADTFPIRIPFWVEAPSWDLQPGDDFTAVWGTGYDKGRALIEIEREQRIIRKFWTDPGRTQQSITQKVTEEMRGGFTLHVTQMRENHLYQTSRLVSVPWTNKDLTLKWEHLSSKLEPGGKDTWTLSVAGPGKEKAAAELVAVLYDASLEALKPHSWKETFQCFYEESVSSRQARALNGESGRFSDLFQNWTDNREGLEEYRRSWPWKSKGAFGYLRGQLDFSDEFDPLYVPQNFGGPGPTRLAASGAGEVESLAAPPAPPLPGMDLAKVNARRNMEETAFFFPHLMTGDDGTVKMTFTMPESVTAWRFMGFAHDQAMRSGFITGETVTAKDFMVQPNPPRFLREGDLVEFTVKITNQSATPAAGTARLSLSDAASLAPVDAAVGNETPDQAYSVPAKESRTLAWRLRIPDGMGFLRWKAVAGNDKLSDGEEGWLPVLPRRVLVTESLPLPIRDAGEKDFTLKKLSESAGSGSLQHQSLTVQMVSQPVWYAIMALPYLMEYPHECSEQTFNRFYANTLARHIAKSDPKIRQVFDLWKDAQPEAMNSPLEKNADLKAIAIEETPWLGEAKNESRRNMGILFDENRLEAESARLMTRLGELQDQEGAWPWFPGGKGNEFITLYIVSGFGRLRHLGVEVDTRMALKALDDLDLWMSATYHRITYRKTAGKDNFSSTMALYLYGRSFFLQQRPVPAAYKKALDYFLAQAREHWTTLPRMSQAHTALGLLRFGDKKTPGEILASLQERSLNDGEMGMHWEDGRESWAWNAAPVETQAMMVEAFREIGKDDKAVDDCQTWLLKQKQTHAWPTTKATADAVYAIVLGGTTKLSSGATVAVSLGGKEVKPEKVEAGTGFYEHRFSSAEVKPDMGNVKLVKTDKGVAWGSVHWQYMEDMSKITPHEGTPLKVTKALFTKVNTPSGPELRPVTGKVKVGDELVIRLELRTDRDMEFVHLKDQRPASVEPVNVLSGYKRQGGLGYYESTKDTASHFFFESLRKGTYVFEYSTRVQLRGKCQAGIAELQCMYAPEYNSHSAAAVLEVE